MNRDTFNEMMSQIDPENEDYQTVTVGGISLSVKPMIMPDGQISLFIPSDQEVN